MENGLDDEGQGAIQQLFGQKTKQTTDEEKKPFCS